MVIDVGQRFTIRENAITTITGLVTKSLPPQNYERKGFNKEKDIVHKIQGNAWLTMKNRARKKN